MSKSIQEKYTLYFINIFHQ